MNSAPLGKFRAHSTRDGQQYYAINRLSETSKPERQRDLFEIQFADDLWMLVRLDDLIQVVPRASA